MNIAHSTQATATRPGLALLVLLSLALAPWLAGAQAPPPPGAPAVGEVTYQTFYDSLSPYGQWVSDPDYGYAWVPAAGADFQPYRNNGHWVYTDYGWTWVSDYAWGWAPFHYGRWRYSDGYGWLWVPGYRWGPAWVAWRQSAGYYGWAPLGPPPVRSGVRVSIGLSFSFGDAPVAPARWCFVPAAYVASPRIATYYVPPARTTVVYNQTTIIHNTYINKQVNVNNTTVINNNRGRRGAASQGFPAGPARADVEHATGQSLQQVPVASRSTPGTGVQGRSLAFYRPDVTAPGTGQGAGRRGNSAPGGSPTAPPAPRQVVPLAQAARQARAARPGATDGLERNQAAQQLSSADPHPFRTAQAAARQPQATGANATGTANATNQPAGTNRRNRFGSNAVAPNGQSAANGAASPSGAASGSQPTADQATRAQLRQQRMQQRQQQNQLAGAGQSNAAQAAQPQSQLAQQRQAQQQRQMQQQARQEQMQQRQQDQMQQRQQQTQRQQMQQERPPARPPQPMRQPRPTGGEDRRH